MATRKKTTKRRTKKKQENKFIKKFLSLVFSTHYFPLILTTVTLAILFVLFRMRGVEQDYKYHELSEKIDSLQLEGKELKAKKARKLSVKNLRAIAKKYNLGEATDKQIIVIP